jgi:hypothetical protein
LYVHPIKRSRRSVGAILAAELERASFLLLDAEQHAGYCEKCIYGSTGSVRQQALATPLEVRPGALTNSIIDFLRAELAGAGKAVKPR